MEAELWRALLKSQNQLKFIFQRKFAQNLAFILSIPRELLILSKHKWPFEGGISLEDTENEL